MQKPRAADPDSQNKGWIRLGWVIHWNQKTSGRGEREQICGSKEERKQWQCNKDQKLQILLYIVGILSNEVVLVAADTDPGPTAPDRRTCKDDGEVKLQQRVMN